MHKYNLLQQHSSFKYFILFLEGWLATGLFIQLAGAFVINNGYRTWVYLCFYLPLVLLLIFNFKSILVELKLNARLYSLLFIFLFYFGFSTLWSDHENLTKELQSSLLCFLYVMGVAIISKKEKWIHTVLSSAVLCIALFALLFIIKNYLINELPLTSRIYNTGFNNWGSLENPQIFGMFLGSFFVIGIMLARKNIHTLSHQFLFFTSLLILFCAFFTYSRTMWVALFFTLFCYMLINKHYKALLYGFIILFVLTLIVLLIFPEIYDKFIYRSGFSFRPQIWLMTISHIIDKPLFGYGSNSFFNHLVIQTIHGKEMSYTASHPHNLYLSIFYFTGLIGVILYFLVLAETLLKIKKYLNDYLVWLTLSLILFSLAEQIFEISAIVVRPNEYYVILWLPIGILLGRISYAKQNNPNNL